MSALTDLALSVHRVIWFPVHAALGLEQPGVELPVQYTPGMGRTDPLIEAMERPSHLGDDETTVTRG